MERVADVVRIEQQAALMAGGTVSTLDERVAEFDAALVKAPKVVNPEQLELRRALGLRT